MSSAWNETRALEIVRRHDGREGALLPILHDVQAAFGCVPVEAISLIAAELNLTRAEVHGVMSFYHDFRARPPGRHVLKLCRAEACQAVNGKALAEQLLKRFGLTWGETTLDGALTVEATYCLGLCACAPSAMLDDQPMARLDQVSIEEIAREVGR